MAVLSLLAGRAGIAIVRLIAIVLIARVLTTADLGRFTFLMGFFAIFQQLTCLGAEQAASVEVSSSPNRRHAVATLLLLAILLGFVSTLLFAATVVIAREALFEGFESRSLLAVGVFLIPAQVLAVCRGIFVGREKYSHVNTLLVLPWIGFCGGVVWCATVGEASLHAIVLSLLIPLGVGALLGAGMVVGGLNGGPSFPLVGDLLRSSLLVYGSQTLSLLQMRIDLVIVRLVSTAEQVAYYGIGTNMTEWMLYLPRSFATAMLPRSAKRMALDIRHLRIQMLLMAVAGLAMVVSVPFLVPLVFGQVLSPAIPVVLVLIPGTVLLGHGVVAGSVLLGRREFRSLYVVGSIASVGFVLLDFILVPEFGAIAAGAVSSGIYCVSSVFMMREALAGSWSATWTAFNPFIGRSFRQSGA